jgi:PAS domain S-box-containing protein
MPAGSDEIGQSSPELRLQHGFSGFRPEPHEAGSAGPQLYRIMRELRSLNRRMQRKIDQLEARQRDLLGLLADTDVACIFLDRDLRVRYATPDGTLQPGELDDGSCRVVMDGVRGLEDIREDVAAARNKQRPIVRELDIAGRRYARVVTPVQRGRHGIEGAVVALRDISLAQGGEQREGPRVHRAPPVCHATGPREETEWDGLDPAAQQPLLQALLHGVADGVVVVDRNDRVVTENPAVMHLVGHAAPIRGARWSEAVPTFEPDGSTPLPAAGSPTRRALEGEEIHHMPLALRDAEKGGFVLVEVNAAPLRDKAGSVVGAVASFRDITVRECTAQAEARLAALVRSTPAAVLTWTTEGAVVDWNDGAARLFGYDADEVRGRDVALLSMAGERRDFTGRGNPMQPAYDREVVMRHKCGRPVHVAWTATLIHDRAGRVVAGAGVGADISERARMERQVALTADEQRRQLGHDLHDSLGQQLTAIGFLANALKSHLEPGAPSGGVADKLETVVEAAKTQLRAIIKGLAPLEVDANSLVVALEELAKATRETHGVDCRFHCAAALQAGSDFAANQLFLIAREAVHNAVKHGRPEAIVMRLEQTPALRLSIEDDGAGIAPTDTERGDGMGLRIMHYRSRIAGGVLKIEARADGGTLVTCALNNTPDAEAAH